jgi:hypothetical protein
MNIYEIGEEKCIEGVWGREVNGRFYTLIVQEDKLGRFLDIDVNPAKLVNSLAILWGHSGFTYYNYEEAINSSMLFYKYYIPKHIKDLENLKRGDIVWVKFNEYNKEQWAMARYVFHNGHSYVVSHLFDTNGKPLRHYYHSEVFLKPPFDL